MKKRVIILCALVIIAIMVSFSLLNTGENVEVNDLTLVGNIQNGGYVIKYNNYYIYSNQNDYNHLYKSSEFLDNGKELAGDHFFYEMNLYGDEIYYISSSPGEVWKISPDGSSKRKLVNKKVGNLILYNNHMYYRLSEDNDWGKLYCADLNGRNKKILAHKVKKFCIYDNLIYYFDIEKSTLCSMHLDGTYVSIINNSDVDNIFAENNVLVYSDHNRNDKLYTYDLKKRVEKCISEDRCWNLNCNNEWIFYRNQSDKGSLYCVSFDGNTKRKIIDGNVADILIVDDSLFYRNVDKDNKIEYLNFEQKIGR